MLLNRQRERFTRGELNPWNLETENPDKLFVLPKEERMEDVAAWTAVVAILSGPIEEPKRPKRR